MMSRVTFSVVTPTYNRDKLLSRVYDSLQQQDFKDFEWIVIDDGSTDMTEDLIEGFSKNSSFNVIYIKTPNKGKANALNESLKYCSGLLYLVFDSDDWCDRDALSSLFLEYVALSKRQDFIKYGALSCLKRHRSGFNVGDNYDNLSKYGLSYIDRVNKRIKGDKWECLVFDIIKNIRYPVQDGDSYMAPGYVWLILAGLGYKTVFINKQLSTIEYQNDGISKNNFSNRYKSSKSSLLYYKCVFNQKGLSFFSKARYYINYLRFSFHANERVSFDFPYFILYPISLLMYLRDKFRF